MKVAADPDVVSRAIENQQAQAPSPISKDPQPGVSAEQLRQRAQGALLSLKPHNIAYDELVAEGLNPSILKTLYEQVGLKISSSSGNSSKISNHAASLTSKQAAPVASTNTDHTSPKTSNASPPSASSPSADSNPQTEKPLERKELIARKLAAAAQAAAARTAKVPSVESNAVAKDTQSAPTPSSSATPDESLVKKTAVPVRQKNKAQTELARQRILDLQRQAALKSQQKNKETQQSQVLQQHSATDGSNAATPAAQHPLPVRPPIPQSSYAATLPGLVMVDSNRHDSSLQTPEYASPTITMDSTPISRPSQLKRPRASDFDELESGSKKHMVYGNDSSGPSGPEKLIIEFSDDESLYEDDDMMDTSQEFEAPQTASRAPSRPALPKYASAISTPQGSTWHSDNEDMQRKNQEIQEMHRRIAYLEEKRKAKAKLQAAVPDGADSSQTTDDSGKSSSLSTTESNPPNAEKTNASSGSSPSNPAQQASTLTDTLQSASKLEGMTPTIPGLRHLLPNRVTHSQLPAPSGSGTSRVAQIESNARATSSVSLETSTAAPFSKPDDETNLSPVSNDAARRSPSQSRSESSSSAMDESADVSSPSQASSSDASAVNGESTGIADEQASVPSTDSVHSEYDALASPSNITGSAKDESTDSSDSDDDGSDQDSTFSIERSADDSNAALGHPHPEHTLPAANEDVTMEDSVNQTSPSDGFRRESSADSNESDAYEPPEPEDTAEPDSPYSPPFSPAPHASVDENAGNAVAFLDEPSAEEKLTDAPLVPVSENRSDPQTGTLGV